MNNYSKVAILGGGAFALALARLLSTKSLRVLLWSRDDAVCHSINKHHHHPSRLSTVILPQNIEAHSDVKLVIEGAEIVILALPMDSLSSILLNTKQYFDKKTIIISASKGIEESSSSLSCHLIKEYLDPSLSDRACYLSGPSFAVELAHGLPTALVLASAHQDHLVPLARALSDQSCSFTPSDDVIGVCLGGALKNVYAILSGLCLGLGLGKNAVASLVTVALWEMRELTVAMGGRPETIYGLAGVGDLVLSCTDSMSRNHRLGTLLATASSLEAALKQIGSAVEGVKTIKSVPALSKKYGVLMPLASKAYEILYEGRTAHDAMGEIFSSGLKTHLC